MRRLILAVTAVAALAGGGSLASTSADALSARMGRLRLGAQVLPGPAAVL